MWTRSIRSASLCLALLAPAWLAALPPAAEAGHGSPAPYTSALDNGILKVGIDANAGGAISYLSPSGSSTNLINTFDLGREVQQSYYAGNPVDRSAEGQRRPWSPWAWNPIGAGDAYGNRPLIDALEVTSTTIYVKSQPLLWDMNDELCECMFRTWITLEGGRVRVHNRLTTSRTDTRWPVVPSIQELPAVYPIADLPRVVSYTGSKPFAWQPISEISRPATGWISTWNTREHWGACVNQGDWGMGVYTPGRSTVIGGLYGSPGGGPDTVNTCYLSPIADGSARSDDQVRLRLLRSLSARSTRSGTSSTRRGNLRSHLRQGSPAGDGQVWSFDSDGDFGGWHAVANIASSSVTSGRLEADATNGDPYVHSATIGTPARDWKVTLRLRNGTPSSTAQLFFTTAADQTWTASKSKRIRIAPNSPYQEYTFDMSDVSTWRGTIDRLRLDPAEASGSFAIDWIRIGSD